MSMHGGQLILKDGMPEGKLLHAKAALLLVIYDGMRSDSEVVLCRLLHLLGCHQHHLGPGMSLPASFPSQSLRRSVSYPHLRELGNPFCCTVIAAWGCPAV